MAKAEEKEFDAQLAIRCRQHTRDGLARLANAENRSLSNYIRLVLERHVETAQAAGEPERQVA